MPHALSILLWLGMGCGTAEPDAALFAAALAQPDGPAAVGACGRVQAADTRDECLATVVRQHDDPALDTVCDDIDDARWAGECWFTVAERRQGRGDRWPALEACGQSGPFYDECIYHLWTMDLAAAAQGAGRAVDAVAAGARVVAFWQGLETIGPDPAAQLWGDFWFFAHNLNRPARLSDCADAPDVAACEHGTETFVLRALLGELLAPGVPADLLDRVCRTGQIPQVYTDGLFVPDPRLDAQRAAAAEAACKAAAGEPVRRWNPVFSARGGAGPQRTAP